MALWKNVSQHGWTGPIDFGDESYTISVGEVGEIPEKWTPWVLSRQYPLERVDAPPKASTEAAVEAAPVVAEKPMQAVSAAAARGVPSSVVITDSSEPTAPPGEQKTPVTGRGRRMKPPGEL